MVVLTMPDLQDSFSCLVIVFFQSITAVLGFVDMLSSLFNLQSGEYGVDIILDEKKDATVLSCLFGSVLTSLISLWLSVLVYFTLMVFISLYCFPLLFLQ